MKNVISGEMISRLEKIGCRHETWSDDIVKIDICGTGWLDVDYYKTGNVSDATYHGEKISNSQARRYLYDEPVVSVLTGTVRAGHSELRADTEKLLEQLWLETVSPEERAAAEACEAEAGYPSGYTCTCKTCGKEFHAFGKWFTTCPDCLTEQKRQEDLDRETELGLPQLSGTERQLKWARNIRMERYWGMVELADHLFTIATLCDVSGIPYKDIEFKVGSDEGYHPSYANEEPGPDILAKVNEKREGAGKASLTGAELSFSYQERCLMEKLDKKGLLTPQIEPLYMDWIRTPATARWWIDSRFRDAVSLATYAIPDIEKQLADAEEVAMLADVSQEEYTVRPEEVTHDGIVEIQLFDDKVRFLFEKDDAFIQVMHEHECKWVDKKWTKTANVCTPSITDLTAEIGADLIEHGFVVSFPTAETMQAAVDGTYEVEHHQWILVRITGEYEGWFAVCWPGKDEGLYKAARKIKGSKYSSPCVVVPPARWKELLDFCDAHDFRISPKAQSIIDTEQAKLASAVLVKPKKPRKTAEKPQKTEAELLAEMTDDDD